MTELGNNGHVNSSPVTTIEKTHSPAKQNGRWWWWYGENQKEIHSRLRTVHKIKYKGLRALIKNHLSKFAAYLQESTWNRTVIDSKNQVYMHFLGGNTQV